MRHASGKENGFTLVEVLVVLILLTLSFMVFLRALNTGEIVRAKSEIRTIQSVILNSEQSKIRGKIFDSVNGYNIPSLSAFPQFGCSVEVKYCNATPNGIEEILSGQTNMKIVIVSVTHPTLPTMVDSMVISSGI